MFEMKKSEDVKGEEGNEEKEKRGVKKEELLQRQRERRQEKAGKRGVKWETAPKSMGGDYLFSSGWDMPPTRPIRGQVHVRGGGRDMPPTPIRGQVHLRGGGKDIPPTPIRIRGGGRDSRTVVLLLSACLAASLPQGNSH